MSLTHLIADILQSVGSLTAAMVNCLDELNLLLSLRIPHTARPSRMSDERHLIEDLARVAPMR